MMTKLVRYSKPLVIRLRPEQRASLHDRAESKGKNVSEYIRDLVDQDEKITNMLQKRQANSV
jgi:predicted DNA-binding protein